MNVINTRQKFSAHPVYLSFVKFSCRQNIVLKQEIKPKYV